MRGADGLLPEGVLVIGIDTPLAMRREQVRERVRSIAKATLASLLAGASGTNELDAVELDAQPGQRLHLAAPHQRWMLSVSHAPGLSLLALSAHAGVGIDLMQLESGFDWANEHAQVASDYLGPASFKHIDALPSERQQHGFALAWTALEAGLKLHGCPLQEWNTDIEKMLEQCNSLVLQLPEGMVGTLVATPCPV